MTENPWLSQPDATPYPKAVEGLGMYWDSLANFIRSIDGRHSMGAGLLSERIAVEFMPPLLAEAERRGAEKGWDEGWKVGSFEQTTANPYRKPQCNPDSHEWLGSDR